MRSFVMLVVVGLVAFLVMPCVRAQTPEGREVTIQMKVAGGGRSVTRDPRIFSVPVKCNGREADFVWGCGGWTTVTEAFARKCELQVRPDRDTADVVDASGQAMFLGQARADIRFGNRQHLIDVKVMRDTPENKGSAGTVGYDLANQFQWQLDPGKPELVLRELGTTPPESVVASLPLKDERENLWVAIKCRGKSAELMLMPQSTDSQLTAEVQAAWGVKSAQVAPAGAVIPYALKGEENALELAEGIREAGLVVMLLPDVANAQAGVGASLLNRFVYCVDAKRKELVLVSRVATPGGQRRVGVGR